MYISNLQWVQVQTGNSLTFEYSLEFAPEQITRVVVTLINVSFGYFIVQNMRNTIIQLRACDKLFAKVYKPSLEYHECGFTRQFEVHLI